MRREVEFLLLGEFRREVVVVSVEPLGHFLRRDAVTIGVMAVFAGVIMRLALRAARHGEIGRERDLSALPAVNVRNRANHDAGVEDLIVEREIVRRNDRDAERVLTRPVGDAQRRGGLEKRFLVGFARPEVFERDFEFAPGPIRGVPSVATGREDIDTA